MRESSISEQQAAGTYGLRVHFRWREQESCSVEPCGLRVTLRGHALGAGKERAIRAGCLEQPGSGALAAALGDVSAGCVAAAPGRARGPRGQVSGAPWSARLGGILRRFCLLRHGARLCGGSLGRTGGRDKPESGAERQGAAGGAEAGGAAPPRSRGCGPPGRPPPRRPAGLPAAAVPRRSRAASLGEAAARPPPRAGSSPARLGGSGSPPAAAPRPPGSPASAFRNCAGPQTAGEIHFCFEFSREDSHPGGGKSSFIKANRKAGGGRARSSLRARQVTCPGEAHHAAFGDVRGPFKGSRHEGADRPLRTWRTHRSASLPGCCHARDPHTGPEPPRPHGTKPPQG
ncbi:uncharacterized protein PS065_010340 [Dugong dugon]